MNETHPLTGQWIVQQKKMAAALGQMGIQGMTPDQVVGVIRKYKLLSRTIAIAMADGKCVHCKTEEKLTFHHLIERKNKGFIPMMNYSIQRHYFACVYVMCAKCHDEIHGKDNLNKPEFRVKGQIAWIYKKILDQQKEYDAKVKKDA